jgi:hypothetical protein
LSPLHSATSPPAASGPPTTSSASVSSWPTAGARSSSGTGKRSMLHLPPGLIPRYYPCDLRCEQPFSHVPIPPFRPLTPPGPCFGLRLMPLTLRNMADLLSSQRARPRENVVPHLPDPPPPSRRRPRPSTPPLRRPSEREGSAGDAVERI